MIDIKAILVPVDFSDSSRKAVNYGLSLALQFNARLVLAHIVPANVGRVCTCQTESFAFEEDQEAQARSMLPLLVWRQYRDRVNLQTIVDVGVVEDKLLTIVKDEKIDLVVMSTHGIRGLQRFILGSVTERMLRLLPVPLLTVSHLHPAIELHDVGPVSMREMLYASDLSDNACVGLKRAAELARLTGARLTVLHVLKTAERIYWGHESGYLSEDRELRRQNAFDRLRGSIDSACFGTGAIVPMMREGDAFREILRVADEEKMSLIVMTLKGKSLVDRALLGSTAERVIRSAKVPVLSIPIAMESTADRCESKSPAA
jgi:nucleotide-binding universal stress UspA family protein